MSRWSRFLRRAGLTLAAVGVVGAIVGSVWYRRAYTIPPLAPDPPVKLPSPNGYDTLRDAARQIVRTKDGVTLSTEKNPPGPQPLVGRKRLLAANEPAIATVRRALTQEILVPPSNDSGIKAGAEFRKLARMLAASAETLADAGDLPAAARCGADAVEIGVATPRGGRFLPTLIGAACESIGDRSLWSLVDRLDAATARATALRLERIEARRPAYADVLRAEGRAYEKELRAIYGHNPTRAWRNTGALMGEAEETVGALSQMAGMDEAPQPSLKERATVWAERTWFKTRIAYQGPRATLGELDRAMGVLIRRAEGPWQVDHARTPPIQDPLVDFWLTAVPQGEFSMVRARTETALLRACLALRAFRLERGRYPESLYDLPADCYLESVPVDPFSPTRAPLLYRRNADGTITLYSVGPDAQDDGGKPIALRGADGTLRRRFDVTSAGDIVARIDTR